MRSRDAKQRERKQIDDAWGKDRSKREQKSKELHDDKKGGGNDRNKDFEDLKDNTEKESSKDSTTNNLVAL
jgi:hypothetical protein